MSKPHRFLLVDDNPQDRTLVARELRKGYPDAQILEVKDQEQLERALEEGAIDVVITDYQLQWSDGLRVLNAAKTRDSLGPVIMFTATGNEEIAVEAMKNGLDDYVIKNVRHLKRLCAAVQAAFANSENTRKAQQLERELNERDLELAHVSRLLVLGEMVAGIAHEVNQPLNAIANYSTAGMVRLEQGCTDQTQFRDTFQQISQHVNIAAEIVRKYRQLAIKQRPAPKPTDINGLLRECLTLIAFELRQSGSVVRFQLAPDIPLTLVDRTQILQVVTNLLRNASDAMEQTEPADREIVVASSIQNEHMEVSVSDRGHGLPEEGYERLLQPFVTTKPHGMGMGLAVSSRIIKAHGGELWATRNEGSGTTFYFTLPLTRETSQ